MRIGILLPTRGIVMRSARRPPVYECWEVARHCDQAGYDAGRVGDSIVAKPQLERFTKGRAARAPKLTTEERSRAMPLAHAAEGS